MSKTLGEVVEVFLDEYKATTRRTYSRDLGMMMRYIAADFEIDDISDFDVIRAIQTYEKRPSVNSVHTVNKFIKTVKRFFNWCVKLGLLDKSPAYSADYRRIADVSVDKKAMPQDDFDLAVSYYQALSAVKPQKYRALGLFLFLYDTGCRRGGVAGLQWSDVSFEPGGGIARVTEKSENEKLNETREVWFGALTSSVLRQWQLVQKLSDDFDYVFSSDGKPMTPPALGQYFARRCKEAGLSKAWRPHSLRHRFGFRMEENNVPDHVAAEALGHRNVNTYRKHYVRKDRTLAKRATRDLSYKLSNQVASRIQRVRQGTD